MPYITRHRIEALEAGEEPTTAGELNYAFTQLARAYMKRDGKSYATINTIMGVFQCAALEFYRRVGATYENSKISENGDVYEYEDVHELPKE